MLISRFFKVLLLFRENFQIWNMEFQAIEKVILSSLTKEFISELIKYLCSWLCLKFIKNFYQYWKRFS